MADNSTEIKLKITSDKQGLAIIKEEFKKQIADLKANYSAITQISKQQSQVEIQTAKETSKQKIALTKQETELKKIETQKQIADDKIAYQEKVRLIRQQEAEVKRVNRELQKEARSNKGMSLFQGLEFGENLTVVSAGLITVFNQVKKVIGEALQKSLDFQKALSGLKFASDNITFKGLQEFNKEFKFGSIFSAKDILQAETFLSLQGRTESEIKKVIRTAMDLSTVTGDDLDSAVRKLDMTYEGSIGRLGRMDERLKKLSTTELENGAAIDIIAEKYGGFANQQAETLAGKLLILEKNYEGLKRSFGDSIITEVGRQFDYTNKSAKDLEQTFTDIKKSIDFVVFAFGTMIRIMPNLYSIGRNVTEMFSALGDVWRFITDPAYSLTDAIESIWDKLSNTIPLLNAFLRIYKYFSPSESDTGSFTSAFDWNKKINEIGQKRFKEYGDFNTNLIPQVSKSGSRGSSRGGEDSAKEQLDDVQKLTAEITKLNAEIKTQSGLYGDNSGIVLGLIDRLNEAEHKKSNLLKIYGIVNPMDFTGKGIIQKEQSPIGGYSTLTKEYSNPFETVVKSFHERMTGLIKDQMTGVLDIASQITNILGFGADTFVGKLINGFNSVLSLADSVINLLVKFGAIGANAGTGGIFGIIGSIFGFAEGGLYSGYGTGRSDSNLIRVSNGEYIVNADSTSKYLPLLQAINNRDGMYNNRGMYANGGVVNSGMGVNVYLAGAMDGQKFFRVNEKEFRKFQNATLLK